MPVSKSTKWEVEVEAPFKASELVDFVNEVPDTAEVTIVTNFGGDQRDPYPTGYVFTAKLETEK